MKGLILLTRPEGLGAQASLRRLRALGWGAVHAPLTRVAPLAADLPPELLASAQAFVFTSAEGVRRFAALSGFRGKPVHAVGAATARAAQAAGFAEIEEGGGDARSLGAHLAARLRVDGGAAIHFGAQDPAGDLPGVLRAAGLRMIQVPLYRLEAAQALAAGAAEAFETGKLRAALFHAPSAARAFAALHAASPLPIKGLTAVAISPAAAAPLRALGFARLVAAPRPDEAHMLGALAGRP